jgi:hypothetical protein
MSSKDGNNAWSFLLFLHLYIFHLTFILPINKLFSSLFQKLKLSTDMSETSTSYFARPSKTLDLKLNNFALVIFVSWEQHHLR